MFLRQYVAFLVQSISVIGPAFLAGEIGPYKQIGPVSSTHVQCQQVESKSKCGVEVSISLLLTLLGV